MNHIDRRADSPDSFTDSSTGLASPPSEKVFGALRWLSYYTNWCYDARLRRHTDGTPMHVSARDAADDLSSAIFCACVAGDFGALVDLLEDGVQHDHGVALVPPADMGQFGFEHDGFEREVVSALCRHGSLQLFQSCTESFDPKVWRGCRPVLIDGVCTALGLGRVAVAQWLTSQFFLGYKEVARRARLMRQDCLDERRSQELGSMIAWCENRFDQDPPRVGG